MHLGFRGGTPLLRLLGHDSAGGSVVLTSGITGHGCGITPAGVYRNIYEDGILVSSSGGHGPPGQGGETLTIGTNGNNGGDLAGSLDDIRVQNTALSAAGVLALYQDSSRPDLTPLHRRHGPA